MAHPVPNLPTLLLRSRQTSTPQPEHQDYDLLSFLSIVLNNCYRYDKTLALLGVTLPNDLYTPMGQGNDFRIAIIPSQEVLNWVPLEDHDLIFGGGEQKSIPQLFAV